MGLFQKVEPKAFEFNVFSLFDDQWFLLTAGDFEKKDFNTMTISWGSMGIMWNRPFVQVAVRPTRFTYQFMNRYDYFTLCAFPEKYRFALQILGSRSGKDGNKIADSGLTPIISPSGQGVAFEEAQLIIEAKKIYWDDFDPQKFVDPTIEENYSQNDYHRFYFGEIVNIFKR